MSSDDNEPSDLTPVERLEAADGELAKLGDILTRLWLFHPLPAPTRADVIEVARRTAGRVERILQARGRSLDPGRQVDEPSAPPVDEPTLAAYYAASAQGISVAGERAGKPTLRLVVAGDTTPRAADDDEPVAQVGGSNVHAKQRVDGRDRAQIERRFAQKRRPGKLLRSLNVPHGFRYGMRRALRACLSLGPKPARISPMTSSGNAVCIMAIGSTMAVSAPEAWTPSPSVSSAWADPARLKSEKNGEGTLLFLYAG